MNPERLKQACKAAGLEVFPAPANGSMWGATDGAFTWYEHDPALPAHAAGLLVAKVVVADMEAGARDGYMFEFGRLLLNAGANMCATNEQRIEAAMIALAESNQGK
jgi:hypothetical protein